MMKKIKKKYIVSAFSMFVVLIIAITMAFFSDKDIVTNSFVFGDVDLKLVEPHYPEEASDRILSYGQKMNKDPQILNTGKNDELVFLKVSVPCDKVILLDENGQKKTDPQNAELFAFLTENNSVNDYKTDTDGSITHPSTWILLKDPDETNEKAKVYLFGYTKKISKDEMTDPLFNKVRLANFVEQSSITTSMKDINITAYGIQADGVDVVKAESNGTYSQEALNTAFDKMRENESTTGASA